MKIELIQPTITILVFTVTCNCGCRMCLCNQILHVQVRVLLLYSPLQNKGGGHAQHIAIKQSFLPAGKNST